MQTINIDQLREIYNTAIRGNKIMAIKMLREGTNHPEYGGAMGLGEAKRLVEFISDVNSRDGTRPDFDTIVSLLQAVRPYHGSAAVAPVPAVREVIAQAMIDPELAAIGRIVAEFDKLPAGAASRVLTYLSRRFVG